LIIDQDMFDLHIHEALHHIAQAELWLEKGCVNFVEHHIKLAKTQIVMAEIYTGWHPKLRNPNLS